MDLQKEDIRKELYEYGCGYMLDEYMELFNKIGKIYHKKQLHIPVVSQRSELFEAYEKYRDYDHYMAYKKVIDQEIKEFIAKNCG